ncbi:hypothetical protein C8T65DRAFT_711537 [Cerioporus squamosus]|nr:hypothetical protein C8T65DRAFT_711537 [Cerioporus squamosus]
MHETFRFLWFHQLPIVVQGIHRQLGGRWTPEAFVDCHGDDGVPMVESGCDELKTVTMRHFFELFLAEDHSRGRSVKIKDWPSNAELSETFQQYFKSFMDAVPMPAYTCHDGYLNLIAHFPSFLPPYVTFKPDPGPKVYIASPDLSGEGTTRLHMDVTCAINVLVYVKPSLCGEDFALWQIFAREDTDKLREYLHEHYGDVSYDPIHAQKTYITDVMLRDLWDRKRVRPFVIKQTIGDAIFIPAGCAHQVSNHTGCIKVACDFVSPEGIEESVRVRSQLQAIRHEEMLQLEALIWHAWESVHRLLQDVSNVPTSQNDGCTRLQKKRKNQRQSTGAADDRACRKRQKKDHIQYTPDIFRYRCPHPACETSRRPLFDFNGVFQHM